MNSLDGRIKANAAIVPAGTNGAVSVYVSDTTNVVLDIDGYFTAPSDSTLQFYPLTPCRVVDTRNANGDLGGPFLTQNQERDFPVLESSCIPQGVTPAAYSLQLHRRAASRRTTPGLSRRCGRRAAAADGLDPEQSHRNHRRQRGHRSGRHRAERSPSIPTTTPTC